MHTKKLLVKWNYWLSLVALLLTFPPLAAQTDDGTFTKTIFSEGNNSLVEKYDVFNENDKEYTLKLGDLNSSKYLTFTKSQKSNNIEVYSSSMSRGDGRYSRARSGKIEIKFDSNGKTYDLGGTSYYLRYTTTSIDKVKNIDFIKQLASKNFMYVKVIVVGQKYVFKIGLQGSHKMLKKGTFL